MIDRSHTAPPAAATPRWRRLPEERPGQIIEAALAVFGERGLAAARLEDIARRAGVSKGTIYLYFPNKEALFREMIRAKVVGVLERAERSLRPGSARDQLRTFMRSYWDYLRSPLFETVYRLVHGELHQFPDLAKFYSREVIQRSTGVLVKVISRGIATGEFRAMEPIVAARMLGSMMVAHAVWCGKRDFFPHVADRTDEQCLEEMMEFYLHAITATQQQGGES